MKNIFKIIPFILITISCKAQTPIFNIEDNNDDEIQNAYYRDTNNLLNPFVGTYLYSIGNTSLKIVFQKRIMAYDGYMYEDLLVGEYQYIENGIEKVNTLNNINSSNTNAMSIRANYVYSNDSYWCSDCYPNEKRVMGRFGEHSTHNSGQILISRVTVGGQQAIKINIWWQYGSYNVDTDPVPQVPIFQSGDYILIKQ